MDMLIIKQLNESSAFPTERVQQAEEDAAKSENEDLEKLASDLLGLFPESIFKTLYSPTGTNRASLCS